LVTLTPEFGNRKIDQGNPADFCCYIY